MAGTIKTKDIKILWSRGAGRCSMKECRRKLTMDSSKETESFALGEMCHIIGETNSDKSPRGLSSMPEENRNNYSNLILLCSHHHTEIDKNIKDWPVEILHQIKDEHELWVEETLSQKKITPSELVYSNIIDNINIKLQLDLYNWFISNAVRNIVYTNFIETSDYFEERLIAIDWPNTDVNLETSIIDLMKSFTEYITHYLKYSTPIEPDFKFYREDTTYKKIFPNPDYHTISDRNQLWIRKNFFLLQKFVYNLNLFTKEVRKEFNPFFHLKRGKFLIIDEFGMYGGGESYMLLPKLETINSHLETINTEIKDFENNNPKFI
ncbi:HNH endonuclease [Flavobacterium suzhouense]|uniref:HNH endonuclease n=1 Tax=Flavobacterium suzhouense TaxID=1529638 RepID=A0ABW5NQB4_9FLAO